MKYMSVFLEITKVADFQRKKTNSRSHVIQIFFRSFMTICVIDFREGEYFCPPPPLIREQPQKSPILNKIKKEKAAGHK